MVIFNPWMGWGIFSKLTIEKKAGFDLRLIQATSYGEGTAPKLPLSYSDIHPMLNLASCMDDSAPAPTDSQQQESFSFTFRCQDNNSNNKRITSSMFDSDVDMGEAGDSNCSATRIQLMKQDTTLSLPQLSVTQDYSQLLSEVAAVL